MSEPQTTLTYESVLDLIQKSTQEAAKEAARQREEYARQREEANARLDKRFQDVAEQIEETNQTVGNLGNRVGKMFETLLGEGKLVAQFREMGYKVKTHSQNKVFGEEGTADSGEIDLFLEDGDVAILVEAKTTLSMKDVEKHIIRIEKYRRFVDADGKSGKRFVGAVAGTIIAENVMKFAYENGLYVIIQSARAVEIITPPEGFKAREW